MSAASSDPSTILIIGGTRGLGAALASAYTRAHPSASVYATSRSATIDAAAHKPAIRWIHNVDIASPTAAKRIVDGVTSDGVIDVLIVSAGFFGKESFEEPNWAAQEAMYRTSAIGPVFLVSGLVKAGLLGKGSKVVLVSSESGSIGLRHSKEGGGNYGHHASKAALNMVGKLLSLDVAEKEIAVASVHPGFMRTEMTRSVGFDEFWDEGGAVTPEVAARSLVQWIDRDFDMSKTGQYWAPRGAADIGTAEETLGPKDTLPTPLQLPW